MTNEYGKGLKIPIGLTVDVYQRKANTMAKGKSIEKKQQKQQQINK